MPISEELQAQLDMQLRIENTRHDNLTALEKERQLNLSEIEKRRFRMEALRMAKDVLMENARSKPVDSREVTVGDITNFADSVITYVNK